jgi:hypothetical protein
MPSSTVLAKRDELDKLGTELWNLSTRLRRDEPADNGNAKNETAHKKRTICLLRNFAFLLLDSAAAQAKDRPQKSCVRLMKVALKAARECINISELLPATKIMERAAEYQDTMSKETDGASRHEGEIAHRLRMEYFALRTMLVRETLLISHKALLICHPGVATRTYGYSRTYVRQV